jgi:glucosamine 6-phosphate synthetase-like amidotransferase/phosphosugar isomerase protein
MCGQCGIIFAEGGKTLETLEHLRYIFLRLLALNEFRGKDSSGVAMVNNDGTYRLLKRPIATSKFICLPEYHKLADALSDQTSLLMGHARFATVGSVKKMSNGHPIKSGCCLATANGTIFNASELFRRFRLNRFAEVDSELIARLADRHAPYGDIEIKNYLHALRLCRGQISAVVTSLLNPQNVIILKGNKPLSLRYNSQYGAIVYSSDELHLSIALRDDGNWKKLELSPMTCAVFDTGKLPEFKTLSFVFRCQKRRKNLCAI